MIVRVNVSGYSRAISSMVAVSIIFIVVVVNVVYTTVCFGGCSRTCPLGGNRDLILS